MRSLSILVLTLGLVGCGSSSPAPGDAAADSARDSTSAMDAIGLDAPVGDAPRSDAPGATDAAVSDGAPPVDASAADAPATDAPATDTSALLCSADTDCSGACVGSSCDAAWTCDTDVACTDDIVAYCGCDGVTFFGSSTCAPRPFLRRGACPSADGTNCDRRSVTCRAPEPRCRDGFVAEVTPEGSCWTFECVAIGECSCRIPAQCSNPDIYTCRNDTGRCTPFL